MRFSRVLLWLGFIVGSLTIMLSSSVATFNSYADDLKGIFNLSQLQVEVIAAGGNLGQCAALPAGIFLEKAGARLAFFIAIIFVAPPYFLLWDSENLQEFYKNNYGMLALYMVLIGIGSTIMYLAVLSVNLNNFPRRHRGKVVGFLSALFWVGPGVFSTLYGTQFSRANSSLEFFFVMALLTLSVDLLAAVFVQRVERTVNPEEQEYNADGCEVMQSQEHIYAEAIFASDPSEVSVTGLRLLRSSTFQLLAWTFIFSSSVDIIFLSNQGIILDACDSLNLSFSANIIGPSVAAIGNVLSGVLSDRLVKLVPREAFVVGSGIMQTVVIIMTVFCPCNNNVILAALIIGYFSFGINFTIFPTLVCSYFGLPHFSRNWGAVMLVYGILSGALLLIFGFFYDEQIAGTTTRYCYGDSCFLAIFIVGSVISCCAFVISVAMLIQAYVSRKPLPEKVPTITFERAVSYDSIRSEPIPSNKSHLRPRQLSLVHGSQLIQRSFTRDRALKTDSTSISDWLNSS